MLPANIDSFKSTISRRGGLAKTNYFAIYMSMPLLNLNLNNIASNLLSGNFDPTQVVNDPRDVAFLCESCQLPGRIITTSDYQNIGKAKKKPYDYMNDDVTFTFLLTQDYYIKHFLDAWQASVINFDNYRLNYKGDYARDIQIQQLAHNGAPIYTVNLKNAFPTAVNSIELSNSSENSYQRVTVTIAYDDFEVYNLGKAAGDLINNVKSSINDIPGSIKSISKQFGSLPGLPKLPDLNLF